MPMRERGNGAYKGLCSSLVTGNNEGMDQGTSQGLGRRRLLEVAAIRPLKLPVPFLHLPGDGFQS